MPEPIRPPWLARKRRRKPDFIRRPLDRGEMHAFYVALISSYWMRLSGGKLIVE